MDIGKRILKLREERGLTQREVARRAGLSPSGVGFIELGQTRKPSAETVVAIARALSVPVEELLEEEPAVPLGEGPSRTQRLLLKGPGAPGHDYLALGPEANLKAAESMSAPEIEERLAAIAQEREYLLSLDKTGEEGREIREVTGRFMEIVLELAEAAKKKAEAPEIPNERAS